LTRFVKKCFANGDPFQERRTNRFHTTGKSAGKTSFEDGARVQAYLDASLKSSANGGKLVKIRS
jgi:hypothetical protein